MRNALYGLDWCFVLSCVMILAWTIVWLMYIAALIYGKIHLHRKVHIDSENCLPGVSIAKPLCSAVDPNLTENLSSYFELDYPVYELLFCIQDSQDADVIKLVSDLKMKYPHVDAQIFIGARDTVINPKVNNMLNAYENAKYPLFMISDASIKVKPCTLKDMVSHMTDKVGLVHQLPIMCDGDLSFSRQIEQLWFGGAHARVYVAANAMGINCMTSMSCIFRKKILDDEGGLAQLGGYLGEDYFLAQLIINNPKAVKSGKPKRGWRIMLSSEPALQNSGISTIKSYQSRMKRWMYLRFSEVPMTLILEPIQEHIFMGPLTALAAYYLFSIAPYIFLPAHFVSWIIADYLLLTVLQNKRPAFSICAYVRSWIFREVTPLYMIPNVMRTRTVIWAGKRFLVRYGGVAERVNDDKLIA